VKSARPLTLEFLEDRLAPATWGNPWPDGAHLTLSFAPDGTAVGPRSSILSEALAGLGSAAWQREILRAFQTWAVQANLNIGLVADNGAPLGSPGRPQGDDRFGDLRIAGYDMSREVIAIASPFDAAAGTWAGDVKLNTAYLFGLAGSGEIDLFTALLHEAGHTFGLDHNDEEADSAIAEHYHGAVSGLSAGDIANIRALYGARAPDRFDAAGNNGTLGAASSLSMLKDGNGALGIRIEADVTSDSDADYYTFRMPLNVSKAVVKLSTAGLSLLQGKITVYDSAGRVVASATASEPGQDLVLTLNQVALLGTYYAKVEGASGDVFGIGSYQLEVRTVPLLGSLLNAVNRVLAVVGEIADDLHTDDTMLTASLLPLRLGQTDARYDFAYNGKLRDSWDVDFYRLQAPVAAAGSNVMSVMVWGKDNGGLIPQVEVYDAQGARVAAKVLVNADGVYNVQVDGVAGGATYFVKVQAQGSDHDVGRYFVGVDFSTRAVALETIAEHAVTTQTTAAKFHVERNQIFHFVFTPRSAQAVTMTFAVKDKHGNVLVERTAGSGQTVTASVFLARGDYLIEYRTAAAPPLDLIVLLEGLVLDDPIGPQPEDPSSQPQQMTTPPPGSTSGGTSTNTTSSSQTTNQTSTTSGTSTNNTSTTSSYNYQMEKENYSGPGTEYPPSQP
jgi:hypothetical protein